MFLKNCWYACAHAHELEQKPLVARKIIGQRLVMYQREDGSPAALEDRCSHRFAPLSAGRKEGDGVRCMYHGLLFSSAGKCVEEPGRREPSQNTDIRAFPAVKRWKMIWVWMGEADKADPDLIPDCHFQDDPAWASEPRYRHFKADYRLILDNLLDFSHLTFVHENTLGGSAKIADIKPKIEKTEKGVRITRWYLDEPEIAPYLKGFETFAGRVDRWNIYELETRGNIFSMDSGSAPAGTGAPEGKRVQDAMQFHATQIVTPEDERNAHFFWTYAHNFNLHDAHFTTMLADRVQEGFEEDRAMIEAQQIIIDENSDKPMAYIHFDNGLALGRRLLDAALKEEAAQG